MEISTDFHLPLPPDPGYQLLLDLERVAPCMPGASLGGEREDGSREVTVAVRLGPMKFNYAGTVQISERDDDARRAVLVGSAQEKRGQGSARAKITMTVAEAQDGTSQVRSQAEFELTGRAAQTGRGIVEDVARRMVSDMATCLAAHGSSATSEPPVGAGEPATTGEQSNAASVPSAASGPPSPSQTSATAGQSSPGQAGTATSAPVSPPPPAREIRAGSLMWSIFKDRMLRLWRRLRGLPAQ